MKMWQNRKESTGRIYWCYTRSHCSSVVTFSHIGCEKDTLLKMVKEFVLIERHEYNHSIINDMSDNVDVSMRSIQQLLNAVKSRVGIMYHSKVDNLFEYLKTHPSILSWTDFCEAIVDGMQFLGSNVHDMLDYLFHDWRKLSKQSPPQGLDKLIRIWFRMVLIHRMS